MTGPKLNEMSFVAGERSGTKASAKYVRSSASKARAVLDRVYAEVFPAPSKLFSCRVGSMIEGLPASCI